ncbi:hypothetical protein GGI64_005135 [Rhizobium leguminosarum]|uniref:Uncharacterized protein n=1 Tax=Rhizobium leguminosarum TaxID=384 RepID=A0A7Z0J0R9_RHILE|nr:hypothetical protein [Rhizobium leguminosarum]NYJ14044.1 hypothetical protein [Rhizobium leguminosarum]
MNVALYADYIADLRTLFAELDRHPERFQTFNVRLELVAAGGLIVYETKRRKGLTDSIYYGHSAETSSNHQISQSTAFSAIDRFFALGQLWRWPAGLITAPEAAARLHRRWTPNTPIVQSIFPIARRASRWLGQC